MNLNNYQAGVVAGTMDAKVAYDSPVEAGPFTVAGHAFEDVYALVRRLEALADRLTGGVPQAANGAGQAVPGSPVPLFIALRLESSKAAAAIRDGHNALERIEQHLP